MTRLASAALVLALAVPAAAQTILRGPYLQTPTPGGIIVRWRTDVATDGRVRYGSTPGMLGTSVDDPTLTTEHEVMLSDLAPDTRYHYAVGTTAGDLAGDDASHWFRTSPTPGTPRPARIWVIGDSGFANANAQAVRDAYTAFTAGRDTDLFLLLGDNAYLVGSDTDYQAALFDMHADLLRRVAPWPTFGNHEAISSNALTETGPYFAMFSLPRAGEAGGLASGTEAYYAFDYGRVHFIVLDSHYSDNTPGSAMMTWLEADLQSTTADWVVAFWHHPPYSKGLLHDSDVEGREINMRQNVLPLLEDYGVDLVLCGHSHSYERSPLLDGHYGFSSTLTPSMVLDSGDGDPVSDGAYRKGSLGPAAHEGAVYVVAGSSSEVRNATLNHPAMRVGLLELGSLVLDVDGQMLTGTFVNSLEQTTDTFTIVKSAPACPPAPRTGCTAAGRARLRLRHGTDDDADRLSWRWRAAELPASDVGNPLDQTDLAFCLYDASGALVRAALPPNAAAAAWEQAGGVLLYREAAASQAGIRRVKVKPGTGTAAVVAVRGQGTGLALPALPVGLPLTAQFANRDNGRCWDAVFATARSNGPRELLAKTP